MSGEVRRLQYLVSILQTISGLEIDMKYSITCEQMKWKDVPGILYNRRIPIRFQDKLYKRVVRPAMMYRWECWEVDRTEYECDRYENVKLDE